MCRYICCIEVNVYAHACEGVGEEEDMENREILRRRAGRTRAGTRWVRLAGISKHDLFSSLSFVAVPLSSFEIFFFFLREIFLWNFCARSIRWSFQYRHCLLDEHWSYLIDFGGCFVEIYRVFFFGLKSFGDNTGEFESATFCDSVGWNFFFF